MKIISLTGVDGTGKYKALKRALELLTESQRKEIFVLDYPYCSKVSGLKWTKKIFRGGNAYTKITLLLAYSGLFYTVFCWKRLVGKERVMVVERYPRTDLPEIMEFFWGFMGKRLAEKLLGVFYPLPDYIIFIDQLVDRCIPRLHERARLQGVKLDPHETSHENLERMRSLLIRQTQNGVPSVVIPPQINITSFDEVILYNGDWVKRMLEGFIDA